MATLPDLDTTTAGHVAYYNVINQTVLGEESMTWGDVTENKNINSFEVYDNGYIFQYNDPEWDDVTIRVKTDGWVVAYTGWDGNVNGFKGPSAHNLITKPGPTPNEATGQLKNPSGLVNNRLAQYIRDVVTDLSQWSAIDKTFDETNVGLYEFNYQSYAISYFHFANYSAGGNDVDTRTVQKGANTVTDHGLVALEFRTFDGAKALVDGNEVIPQLFDNTGTFIAEKTGAFAQTPKESTATIDGSAGEEAIMYVLHWSETA